jgi:prolyl 4-hydroxylase
MNTYLIIFLGTILIYLVYLYYIDTSHLNSIDRCSQKYNRDKIYEFDNLLSIDECNTIINLAEPNLQKSTVLSNNPNNPGRTSSQVFLKTNNNLLRKIDNIVYSYLQIPIEHYEDLQVVNYKSTQRYNAHYDACDPSEAICQEDIKILGSLRYATFIIYLNDNFTGGETEFPKHNFKAIPKVGKAVLFFNLNDNNTDRRDNALHGGLPPDVGEKWMCNKWIRLKPIKFK